MPVPLQYWKAYPHRWGPGQTHIIHEDGRKTLCGVPLSDCPGRHVPANEYDCRSCARVIEARENREKREQEREKRDREYKAQRAAQDREWWRWYNAYLRSPEWEWRHAAVLQRAAGQCESCGRRRATQVHHKHYDHVGKEPLFDLVAICQQCHAELTEDDRRRRGWNSAPVE